MLDGQKMKQSTNISVRADFGSEIHVTSELMELRIKQRCRPIVTPPNTVLQEVVLKEFTFWFTFTTGNKTVENINDL